MAQLSNNQRVAQEASKPSASAAVPWGRVMSGELGLANLQDSYKLAVTAGQRYQLTVDGPLGAWLLSDGQSQLWSGQRPSLKAAASSMSADSERQGVDRWIVVSEHDAVLTLVWRAPDFWRGEGEPTAGATPYRFWLFPIPNDDHGDTQSTATPLAAGERVRASLQATDADVFRVQLRAGLTYAFTSSSDSVPLQPLQMQLSAAAAGSGAAAAQAVPLATGHAIDAIHELLSFTPTHDGDYFLRLSGADARVTLSFNPTSADVLVASVALADVVQPTLIGQAALAAASLSPVEAFGA